MSPFLRGLSICIGMHVIVRALTFQGGCCALRVLEHDFLAGLKLQVKPFLGLQQRSAC